METVVTVLDDVVLDLKARAWCKLPYPGHPKGCPNYGKRPACPPQAPLFGSLVEPPFFLVAVKFNLADWARRLKMRHPGWSDRQARCCLYWQGKVRKRLREECEKLASGGDVILYSPEANGVHVFKTCGTVGIKLERNPQTTVWKIAIIGRKRE